MIEQFLLVFLGGGVGSVSRYLISIITPKYYKGDFPLGTFIVNIVGCFVIGIFMAILGVGGSSKLNALLIVGFCGGFTTFSSFSKEIFLLFENKKVKLAFFYIISSCILGILAVFLGYLLTIVSVIYKID